VAELPPIRDTIKDTASMQRLAAICTCMTWIHFRHAALLSMNVWLVSSPFWIGVVQDWCRLSWLAPAQSDQDHQQCESEE